MNQRETVFFGFVIIAYIMCAFALKIPSYINIIFAVLILLALTASILLKHKEELENKRISKVFQILGIILLVLYILTTVSELWFNKTLIVNSWIILVLFLIVWVVRWFLDKKED